MNRSPESEIEGHSLPQEVQEAFLNVLKNAQDANELIVRALVTCDENRILPSAMLDDPKIKKELASWLKARRGKLDEKTYEKLSAFTDLA